MCGAEGAATKPWDMNSFRKPDFVERRDAAAHAKKAALEKFHKSAADPAFAERQTARITNANTRRADNGLFNLANILYLDRPSLGSQAYIVCTHTPADTVAPTKI